MELYSSVLEKLGYDPLPFFREPGESPFSTPELSKEYPLVLTTGYRQPFYFLSQYRNIPWLRSFQQDPTMQIHPDTAGQVRHRGRRLGLDRVAAGQNQAEAPAVPGHQRRAWSWRRPTASTRRTRPGFHGLFISNPNVLTNNNHFDPMYGLPDLTCLLCRVYKASDEDLEEDVFRTEEYGTVPRWE